MKLTELRRFRRGTITQMAGFGSTGKFQPRWLWLSAPVLVAGLLLYGWLNLHRNESKSQRVAGPFARITTDAIAFREALPKPGGPPGYVTSSACKECHPKQFETWWRSHHRQMTQLMNTNTVLAKFNGVTLDFGGERFTLHQSANRFWVDIQVVEELETAQRLNTPAPVPLHIPMEMVTGSHYFQVFWLPSGHGNQQIGFPFTWLVGEKRWVRRNDAFIRDPSNEPLPEQWNMICIRCHATGGRPMPEPEQQVFDTHVTELGIACEACHGPGQPHVAAQRQLKREGEKLGHPASDIVQPAHLDHVRSSQVCGFCHSMKWFDKSERWTQDGFRYRPGDDLEQTTPIIRPTKLAEQPWLKGVLAKNPDILNDFFWPDGMIRVAGREFNGLIESACYQKGELACVTCHSMHKSDPDKQLKAGLEGNQACLTCHGQYQKNLPGHTHHQPDSSGSLCYNCHMPYTSYGLLRGIRSHQIERPTMLRSLNTGRPNACNQCHLDKTLQWTAKYLSEWYGQPMPQFAEEDRKISATVKLLLGGDAGQRALAAFSLGWESALAASGRNWEAPLLAYTLEDPYAAVRFISHRALTHLPAFEGFSYDFESTPEEWQKCKGKAVGLWGLGARALPECQETLTGPGPMINTNALLQLLQQRNDHSVHLRE